MDITDEERHKLNNYKQVFNVNKLTRQQVELILDRKVVTRKNDNIYSIKNLFKEPKVLSTKPIFSWSDVAKHAAKKVQRRVTRNEDNSYRINKLFRDNTAAIEYRRYVIIDMIDLIHTDLNGKFMAMSIFFKYIMLYQN